MNRPPPELPRHLLVATGTAVVRADPASGLVRATRWPEGLQPTCLASDPHDPDRIWAGTTDSGVFASTDGGRTWHGSGPGDLHVTALASSPAPDGPVWAGTEPSALWIGANRGRGEWTRAGGLDDLPSAGEWSFPPKPETHHVRWIACHPHDPGRLWLAVEAGALVSTPDGGASWRDRVPGGPHDTHELAIHPDAPEVLRVAAGDGYHESRDGGATWRRPGEGLEIGYFRSVAVDPGDPETVVLSGATRPKSTYVAGRSDGRVYRRKAGGSWIRVLAGWPDPPTTVAPLLRAGLAPGEFWAADERGVHRSHDGGANWTRVAGFSGGDGPATPRADAEGAEGVPRPHNLRGFVVVVP